MTNKTEYSAACDLYGINPDIIDSNIVFGEACATHGLLWKDCADCEQPVRLPDDIQRRGNIGESRRVWIDNYFLIARCPSCDGLGRNHTNDCPHYQE